MTNSITCGMLPLSVIIQTNIVIYIILSHNIFIAFNILNSIYKNIRCININAILKFPPHFNYFPKKATKLLPAIDLVPAHSSAVPSACPFSLCYLFDSISLCLSLSLGSCPMDFVLVSCKLKN